MGGLLDRYVLRTVVSSYVVCLVFLIFLFFVFDLLVNMGKYGRAAEEHDIAFGGMIWMWVRFHLVSIPWLFVTVAPFVTVISSMFALSRLMNANEIAPMIFTGRSMARLLLPILATGLFSALLMAAMWEFAIPAVTASMDRTLAMLEHNTSERGKTTVALRSPSDANRKLICGHYDPERQRLIDVLMWDGGSNAADVIQISAAAAQWNEQAHDWALVDGEERHGDDVHPRPFLGMEDVTPDLVRRHGKEGRESSFLSYSELMELRAMRPGKSDFVVAFHYHFTYPLANLILLLLALPFVVRFERGGRIRRILVAILICGAYLVVDLTCQTLGRREYLHPIVATWVPTILFGSLGLVIFSSIRT